MKNSKVFKLLKTFSHQERQRFADFLKSIYFNYNDDIIRCFAAILPSLQKTKPIEQTELDLWKKIFPSKKYDKAKFHRVCSDLLKEAERFLAYHKFSQNKTLQNVYVLQSMNEKRAMAQLPHLLKQSKTEHLKQTLHDSEFYYQQYLIEAEQNNYQEKLNSRKDDKNLKSVMNYLDKYYLIMKLQCCCAILHYKNITNIDADLVLMDEILLHLKNTSYKEIPVINIFYHILLTQLEKENEQHFQQLKKLLLENSKSFEKPLAREMYAHAIQYCIKKINSGSLNYYRELFHIYKETLAKKLIQVNNELSPYEYKNIITTGLRLGEFNWIEKFIVEYKNQLPIEHQENAFTFSMARVYFFKKEYDKVLELLQQVEYDDVFYLLDAKVALIKTFYELEEIDSLVALLDSFKMLLRRKKDIAENLRIHYNNFVVYVKKLVSTSDRKKIIQLKAELATSINVTELSWLRDKVEESLNNNKR